MRKIPALVILSGIVLLLVSCSSSKLPDEGNITGNAPINQTSGTTASAPNNQTGNTTASAPANTNLENSTASSSQNITESTEKPVDSGITLESVRKAALDAGYAAEDIQDMQQDMVPSPIRGFYINYKDENQQSQSPVYEFKTSEDAQTFAKQANEAGYSLCIINGKLLTLTGSRYGIVLNDKEKAVLESLLKSSVMVYEEPAPPQVNYNKDYAGAFTRIDAICKSLDRLVNKSVLVYLKSLPEGDPKSIGNVSFSMLSSSDLPFTSALCEDQTKMDEVVQTWEYFGCTEVKLKHEAANDYTLTGKRAGVDETFNIHCVYSPEKDSLRIAETNGGEVTELLEFVPLGEDKYAFQTLYERGIVEYSDGKIISFIYSKNEQTKESAYNRNADSIYPNGTGADEAWVSKSGEDGYQQFITFDGTKLHISATDFTGSKLKTEIEVK